MEAACFVLAAASLHPLLSPGILWGHDAGAHLFRIAEVARALGEGVLYPRFVPDAYGGLGGPILNFNPVAPYYLPALLLLAGIGPGAALKIAAGLLALAGGLATRVLARPLLGRAGAAVAGLAYVYLPYRLADIYVRMAYSELAAMVVLPLAMAAARRAVARPTGKRIAVAGLAAAMLPIVHFPSSVLGYPAIVLYAAFWVKKGRRARAWAALSSLFVLALAISAFSWLPALVEIRGTHYQESTQGYDDYHNHFVAFSQLLSPRWGFGPSMPGEGDRMSFQIGWVHLLGMLALAAAALLRVQAARPLAAFCWALLGASVFFMLPVSRPLWDLAPPLQNVQFPWRCLMLAGIATSLSLGFASVLPPLVLDRGGKAGSGKRSEAATRAAAAPRKARKADRLALAGVVALAVGACLPYLQSRPGERADADFTPEAIRSRYFGELKFQPREVAEMRLAPKGPRAVLVQGGRAEIVSERTHRMTVDVDAAGPGVLRLHLFASPGWRAEIAGKPVPVHPEPGTGLVLVHVPSGRHEVTLRFGGTPARRGGWLLCGAGLIAGLALAAWGRARPAPLRH